MSIRLAVLAMALLVVSTTAMAFEKPTCVAPFFSGSDMLVASPSQAKVEVYTFEGALKSEVGVGQFKEPAWVAVSPKGRIAVCDRGTNTIITFDNSLKLKDRVNPTGALNAPQACAFNTDGDLFVADTGNNRVVAIDGEGAIGAEFGVEGDGKDQLKAPCGIACLPDGIIAVADTGNKRIQILSYDKDAKKFAYVKTLEGWFDSPHGLYVDAAQRLLIADPGSNRCLIYDKDLREFGTYQGVLAGNLKGPESFSIVNGRLATADTQNNRVLLIHNVLDMTHPKRMLDGEVDIKSIDPDKGVVEWDTAVPCIGEVEYGITTEYGNLIKEDRVATHHRLTLPFLAPGKRFHYRVKPAVSSFPEPTASTDLVFTSLPGEGKTWYLTLPVMILLYREIDYRDQYPKDEYPDVPDGVSLTDDEVAAVRKMLDTTREFFWRNSSLRLNVQFDVKVVDEPLSLKATGGFLGPEGRAQADFEAAAKALGHEPEYYTTAMSLYAWQNYVDDATGVKIRQGLGGGTFGVDGPWQYKSIPYVGVPMGRGYDQILFAVTMHELHHAIDSLVWNSGYPSYPHSDQPVPFKVACGQHFDFNAAILRYWPAHRWLCMKYGTVSFATDADNDGFIDADAAVALDESRFKSSVDKKDTDDDGLSDVGEAMAGIFRGSDPTLPDTDGDGVTDAKDLLPLVAGKTDIPFAPITVDGRLGLDPWTQVAEIPNLVSGSALPAGRVMMSWDHRNLYFGAILAQPWTMRLQIDLNGDGWFHGADNYEIEITPQEKGAPLVKATLFDPEKIVDPVELEGVFNAGDVQAAVRKESGGLLYEVGIPIYDSKWAPKPGQGVKWNIAFVEPAPLACRGMWYGNPNEWQSVFELDTFPKFTLVKDTLDAYQPKPQRIASVDFGPAVVPIGKLATRKLKVAVQNSAPGPINAEVTVQVPEGWKVMPEAVGKEKVSGEATETIEFDLIIPNDAKLGMHPVTVILRKGDKDLDQVTRSIYIPMDWRVIGPFDNTDKKGLDTAYAPETEIDLTKSYEGAKGTVGWKALTPPEYAELGMLVDLAKVAGESQPGIYYATTTIVSMQPHTVQFRFGAPGAYEIWVNGKSAAKDAVYHDIGAVADGNAVTVALAPGANRVLVKLALPEGEPFKKPGFYFRVTKEDGVTPPDVTTVGGL